MRVLRKFTQISLGFALVTKCKQGLNTRGATYGVTGSRASSVNWFTHPSGTSTMDDGFVIELLNTSKLPMNQGGLVEEYGRFDYMPGIKTSILAHPPLDGYPALNYMNMEMQRLQEEHSHPSLRIGYILKGRCLCLTETCEHVLHEGNVFIIEPHERHAFQTLLSSVEIVTWHPSAQGPNASSNLLTTGTLLDK